MGGVITAPDGFTIIEYQAVGSSNDEASRLAADGAPDGTVVWAHRQTAGRGRRGRRWQSPEGNLHCSLVMRPDLPAAEELTPEAEGVDSEIPDV